MLLQILRQRKMDGCFRSLVTMSFIHLLVTEIEGHGRLLQPPSRASMWRFSNFSTPINYNDNQLFCGGMHRQWEVNGGKCGVCGDPWDGPRDHEAGGKYATGIIAKDYDEGQTIEAIVEVTVSHMGYFEFRLCPHNNLRTPVTQECLDKILLRQPDGTTRVYEVGNPKNYTIKLVLPLKVSCEQCLLQWKWNTGNSWGCEGNKCCVGCGHQEQFYGCADVSIRPRPKRTVEYQEQSESKNKTTANQKSKGSSVLLTHRIFNISLFLCLSYNVR